MKYIYILLLQLLFACNSNEESYNLCDKFNGSVNIRGELFVDSIVTNSPSAIQCDGSNLIIFAEGSEYINIFDIKDGCKIASAASKGRSAGEVISTRYSGFNEIDSLILVYDVTLKRLNYYRLQNANKVSVTYIDFKSNEYKDHIFNMQSMDNGYIVGYSIYDSKDQFVLFDKNLQYVKTFGDFPLKNIDKLSGTMTGYAASYKNYFAYTTFDFGYISLYEISDNGDIVKKWDKYMSEPLFIENNGKIIFEDKNREGFMNLKMTENYIYSTYSGKTRSELISQKGESKPNEIFVFDYKGNPVKRMTPDYPMYYFDVSKDDKYIYSYVEDQTGKIIRYAI